MGYVQSALQPEVFKIVSGCTLGTGQGVRHREAFNGNKMHFMCPTLQIGQQRNSLEYMLVIE